MVNRVQLIGRLGNDPVLKEIGEKSKLCNCRIATNEYYYDSNNEKVVKTQWHTTVFWNKLAERISKYTAKGDMLIVEGKLINRNYTDKDGIERYTTEVEANSIHFLSSKKDDLAKVSKNGFASENENELVTVGKKK